MFPVRAVDDQIHRAGIDAVFGSQSTVADVSSGMPFTDGDNLLSGQNGPSVPLASGRSPLCGHVGGILGASAQKQMVGIDARRIVAAMADEQAVRDRATVYLPRHPMSASHADSSTKSYRAITKRAPESGPQPAGIRELDMAEKSFSETDLRAAGRVAGTTTELTLASEKFARGGVEGGAAARAGTIEVHRKASLSGVAPPAATNSAGAFACLDFTTGSKGGA